MSSSPDQRPRTALKGAAATSAVTARLDADLRSNPYAAAAVGASSVDPRLVDHRLEPAFRAALEHAGDQARSQGHTEGYAAGYAEGMAAAAADRAHQAELERQAAARRDAAVAQALSALNQAAHATLTYSAASFEALERAAVSSAVELAEMILGQALPSQLVSESSLRRAMSLAGTNGTLVARLHPDDAAAVRGHGEHSRVEIVADPTVAPGDCLLQDGHALVDATLAAAFSRLREQLGVAR